MISYGGIEIKQVDALGPTDCTSIWSVAWGSPPTPKQRWKWAWRAARKAHALLSGGSEYLPAAKRLLAERNA